MLDMKMWHNVAGWKMHEIVLWKAKNITKSHCCKMCHQKKGDNLYAVVYIEKSSKRSFNNLAIVQTA